jgi:hypothetical protein
MRKSLITFSLLLSTHLTAPPASAAPPLFSEDFESGRLDPARWKIDVTGGNIIKVQQDKAAHGKYALLVRCPAPSNKTWAFITAANLPEALRRHHFGRAYIYITPQPPARHIILIMAGTPGFPKSRYQELATANGRWQLTWADTTFSPLKEDYHAAGPIQLQRWVCVEWEFNDHPNHTSMWIDGKPFYEADFVAKDTGAKTDLVGGFSEYSFGFRLWGAALMPFDVYFDDIAIDTQRIGPIKETTGQ